MDDVHQEHGSDAPHSAGGGGAGMLRFEDIFLPHLDAAYNLARWLLRHDQDAEDAVQEAYMRACKAFVQFRGGDGRAWLLTIVRNVCLTMLRKRPAAGVAESFDEETHAIATAVTPATPDAAAQHEHRPLTDAALLHRALEQLPENYREVIVLHELEGLSYKDIAAIADIPIGTVMSRLARARQRLQTIVHRAAAAQEKN